MRACARACLSRSRDSRAKNFSRESKKGLGISRERESARVRPGGKFATSVFVAWKNGCVIRRGEISTADTLIIAGSRLARVNAPGGRIPLRELFMLQLRDRVTGHVRMVYIVYTRCIHRVRYTAAECGRDEMSPSDATAQ